MAKLSFYFMGQSFTNVDTTVVRQEIEELQRQLDETEQDEAAVDTPVRTPGFITKQDIAAIFCDHPERFQNSKRVQYHASRAWGTITNVLVRERLFGHDCVCGKIESECECNQVRSVIGITQIPEVLLLKHRDLIMAAFRRKEAQYNITLLYDALDRPS